MNVKFWMMLHEDGIRIPSLVTPCSHIDYSQNKLLNILKQARSYIPNLKPGGVARVLSI